MPVTAPNSDTAERALAVATRLFAENGYGSTSMRDIARAANVRAATLYHHFPNKAALYQQAISRQQATLREMMAEVLAEESDFRRQITTMIERAFDYHLANPSLAKLSLRAAMGDGLPRPYEQHWLDMMESLLRPRAARGEIKDLDPALFLITAAAIFSQHAIANETVGDLLGGRFSAAEIREKTRQHVQRILLRCLGMDEDE